MVLIDVCRTKTASWTDELLLTRPGTDGALALGIAYVLWQEGLCDEDFISTYIKGFIPWTKEVLAHWSVEKAYEICGVPVDTIRRVARAYGRANAPFIRLGSGNSRYGNGAMTVRLITILPATASLEHMDIYASYGGQEPYWLINRPDERILDSSFNERYHFTEADVILVQIHPVDAKREGLVSGDRVILENERGALRVSVVISEAVLFGTIVLPGVWWYRNSGNRGCSVNVLTSCEAADRGHGSIFYDVKVRLRKEPTS